MQILVEIILRGIHISGVHNTDFITYINKNYGSRGVAPGSKLDIFCNFVKKIVETSNLRYSAMKYNVTSIKKYYRINLVVPKYVL